MISFTTVSRRRIDLENPRPEDISIQDIARGLSHCCRFAGQVSRFYSVAQHSVLVASVVDPHLQLAALLHDASEAYMGDLSRHLKHHSALKGYRRLEKVLQSVIYERFQANVSKVDYKQIKLADSAAVIFEHVTLREKHELMLEDIMRLTSVRFVKDSAEDLVPFITRLPRKTSGLPTTDLFRPWLPWSAEHAMDEFLSYYARLTGTREA